MSYLRALLHKPVNGILHALGLRLINAEWGPRGFGEAFRRLHREGTRPNLIVDVGASNGAWTRECLSIFPDARYFLVDPLVENRQALEELKRERPNVDFWQGALGHQPGELVFFVHGDQSSLLPSEYGKPGHGTSRDVPVRTLDSFLEEGRIQPPDIVKADVQGFELQVMRGAEKCLRSAEFVLLEVSFQPIYEGGATAGEVIGFMHEKGFEMLDFCSYATRPLDGRLAQSDLLFAKKGAKCFARKGWD